ncbi:MAG TPA: SDR family NAD(P)-dependent oxidoreductase [Solirubrobacteraceae bacterium]|jgi:saccharopine dehydrogenase (NAD+, L-lysine-forming)
MRVAVLGAGGTIGPALVRDLAESAEVETIAALDVRHERAEAVAAEHGAGKATAGTVDARDPQALTLALDGVDVLVNAAAYRTNLLAMDAALAARCAYVDLGGLYHVTLRQLQREMEFEEAGVVAVLGAGAAPGKTNVMAAHAAAGLDEVIALRCASAGLDERPPDGLSTPYALRTLLDEVTMPPVVFEHGETLDLDPLADGGVVPFPDPIGERACIVTLHSEVATLPFSLGAGSCSFRLGLEARVLERLRELAAAAPAELPVPSPPSPRTWSAQRVDVLGRLDGERVARSVTALTPPHEAWGLGGGVVSTASVAAATVRLLARGRLPLTGVHPPERALRADDLIAELERVGTTFQTTSDSEVPTT